LTEKVKSCFYCSACWSQIFLHSTWNNTYYTEYWRKEQHVQQAVWAAPFRISKLIETSGYLSDHFLAAVFLWLTAALW